ncbi:MAG: hypothetical protein Q9219_006833 [cf. Caloplaca sp. 3 TL-2023]
MSDEYVSGDFDLPASRIKRPHKKVRSGCATCKVARVKCDERRPRCTRCHRKKMKCSYLERPSTSSSPPDLRAQDCHGKSEQASPESLRSPEGREALCTTNLQDLGGIRDTELAKHYLTHTVQTLVGGGMCEDQSDIWRILIPAVALTCPVVRQGMLTLAAICLHHEPYTNDSGKHSLKYLKAAEAHGKIFVRESRQKLQDFQEGLNTHDPNTVLSCSRLLCVLGFAFFRTHRMNGTTLADAAAWTWLHLLRGVKTSYITVLEAGQPIDEIFMNDMNPPHCYHQPTSQMGVGCKIPCFRYIQQSQREYTDALRITLRRDWSSFGDQQTEDLSAAIDLLCQVTKQVCSQQLPSLLRTICTWPADIPRGFVNMLVDRSPPALAVYAHWLMLMVLVEDLWWIDDMGRAGIRDIISICSDADPGVCGLLIWPQRILDLGSESTDATR